MNKPIWIICADKEMQDKIIKTLSLSCPQEVFDDDRYGSLDCIDGKNCREHWRQFVEFVENEDDKQ